MAKMKGRGKKCPFCGGLKLYDEGDGVLVCSAGCFIMWESEEDKVGSPGQGRGFLCPTCKTQTLHDVVVTAGGKAIYECSKCSIRGIRL